MNKKIIENNNLKKILIVLLVFFTSTFLGLKINASDKRLENFFFEQIIEKNSDILFAKAMSDKILLRPRKNSKAPELELEAMAAISIYVNPERKEKILFKKQAFEKLHIASLTKLMTASVSLDIYEFEQKLEITKKAVEQPERRGELIPGNILSVKDLLYTMLVESSNDAAQALAEGKTAGKPTTKEKEFINLMNKRAFSLKMENTHFGNASGLDPENRETPNLSTAKDLSKFIKYLIFNQPQILEITNALSYEVSEENGFHHFISENINILLKEIPEIIGGKTGYTEEAGGCIILALEAPKNGYIINVILGSESSQTRFEEMRKLIKWTNGSYTW
ncbi:D-alanyl-D-alanine carboxypeptidase [Candidatus Parcubacteria bacterium]|nr:D-alanyl-D-alanine carboxypeptidase [Candidatus Parcubacteria bacterium]